jgi:hypothetical protein
VRLALLSIPDKFAFMAGAGTHLLEALSCTPRNGEAHDANIGSVFGEIYQRPKRGC